MLFIEENYIKNTKSLQGKGYIKIVFANNQDNSLGQTT